MATLKSEPDGKHPASHYLYVGDATQPTTWKLRYKDASGKVSPRLLGACHAALTVGYRGNKVEIPASEKKKCLAKLKKLYTQEGLEWPTAENSTGAGYEVKNVAEFALDGATIEVGDYVVKSGKIFEAGDYADKGFSLTSAEMAEAVADFAPVPIDIEHISSPLDGQLGELWNVAVAADGTTLTGDVAVPAWLAHLLPEMKVSTTWDKGTKRLTGLAIVRDPRVTDAAMMAAFSATDFARTRHDTRAGQSALQDIHNATVRAGAVCKQTTQMASRHESSTVQSIHDMTAEHGATCDDGTDKNGVYAYYGSDRKKTMSSKNDKRNKVLAWLLGPTDEDDAEGTDDPVAAFVAEFDGAQVDKATKKALEAQQAKFQADLKAERESNVALAEANAKMLRERIAESAATFATQQIAAGRATASEQEGIIAAYVNAALADASGQVTFANGAKAGMVDAVKTLVESRPAKYATLFGEQVATEDPTSATDATRIALTARQTTDGQKAAPMTDERRKELLSKSVVGRAALTPAKN
jgi:hypothetical protein